ncbi:RNA-guided endonuclease InsQ/TnpB family protein [Caballeronia glebae]|nr:RNA-guided endonuclease TnpB family protein [Caballeronia glebae]
MSSILQSGVRFRAYPDTGLASILARWIGCQRFIYNSKVSEDRLFAAQRRLELVWGNSEVKAPLDQAYAQFKDRELTPWLYEVPSQILRNGAVRWMNAKRRQLKKLGNAPRRRTRRDFNSVRVTGELFRFVQTAAGPVIQLGTKAEPVGRLPFKAHRPFGLPKSIVLREVAGQWFVSFCYEHESNVIARKPHELAYELNALDDATLARVTLGLDRNVADNCVATSAGEQLRFDPLTVKRMQRKEIGAKRYQRRMARSQNGSANRRKLVRRLARRLDYATRVRNDFAHRLTYRLVNSEARFFVLEDLKVGNMSRRPKAVKDERTGKWLRNRAKAKAGLNRKILASCWGRIDAFLRYKAGKKNKLVGKVPAQNSSRGCSRCGHIHADNRDARRFVCVRCGLTLHADHNAGINIKTLGIGALRDGAFFVEKPKKRIAFRRTDSIPTGGTPEVACGANISPDPRPAWVRQCATKQESCVARRRSIGL